MNKIRDRCLKIKENFQNSFDIFFDIGVGAPEQEAYEIKNIIKRDIEIYGFEASLPRYEILKDKYNGTLFNLMVGDTDGEYNGFLGGGKVCRYPVDNFRVNVSKDEELYEMLDFKNVKVGCITLDSFYHDNQLKDPCFVWADIDGAELVMLKGAVNLMRSKKIVGFNLELSNLSFLPKYTDIIDFLDEYGYVPIEPCIISEKQHKDVLFKLKEV